MAQKSIHSKVAAEMGLEAADGKKLEATMVKVLLNCCCDLDAVAIPGFGTFMPEKNDEKVVTDASGKSFLLPPSIVLKWRASVMLRKNVVS